MNESQIFAEALRLAAAADRAAYLEGACGGDPELRAGVEALLRAHDSDPGFLEAPAAGAAETADLGADDGPTPATLAEGQPGLMLAGRYELVRLIGEGGMGAVWLARQTEPVKRAVAVKLIKPGMDSKAVLARFEAERQALALMDHPNIATVLDAGATPDGRPFFVMELVDGRPITEFCDEHRLTPRQRLELFVPVCQAVQHAHQKGVIHRDLKPSNVLVARYDGRPVPKVIDFGVAKATGPQLTERTLHTGIGAVVGTPEYMSPEQADFGRSDVDTRSDVYSLGVVLYELLAGSPPFARKDLRRAGLLEVLRVIREQEPPRPSAKLSTAAGLPDLAARRGTDPARLARAVRGDLDWIVMKCLEKDRGRRYPTASAVAADVRRYLTDEPVQACPPSTGYRLRKFARRNRGPVLAAVAAVALLVAALGLTLRTNAEVGRALDARNAAFGQLEGQQRETDAARRAAEQRAEEIRAGAERLNAANILLERGRTWVDSPHQPAVGRATARAAADAFDQAVALRPDHSMARDTRGQFFCRLGLFDEAAADLKQAYALRPPADVELDGWSYDLWFRYACLRAWAGDAAGYRGVCDRMREHLNRSPVNGGADYWAARTCALAPGAAATPDELVRIGRNGLTMQPVAKPQLFGVGMAYYRAGRFREAADSLRRASAYPDGWEADILIRVGLALAHHRLKSPAEAARWLDQADRWLDAQVGYTGDTANFRLPTPWWQDWAALEILYRETAAIRPGPGHPAFPLVRARGYAAIGRREQSRRAVAATAAAFPDDPRVRLEVCRVHAEGGDWAAAVNEHDHLVRLSPDPVLRRRCGDLCGEYGRWAEALADYEAAAASRPTNDPLHGFQHAFLYLVTGDPAAYRRHCGRVVGPDAGRGLTGSPLVYAAHTCVLAPGALDDPADVVRLAERRLALKGQHPGDVIWARHVLGLARYRAGQYAEVVPDLEALARDAGGSNQGVLNGFVLAMTYHQQGRKAEARTAFDRASKRVGQLAASDTSPRFAPPGWAWRDWLAVRMLRDEAAGVLGVRKP